MKKTLITLCLAALTSAAGAGSNDAAELDQAKHATAAFGGALKSELVAAMQSGGPIEAIDVCNTRAMLIGEEVSLEQGMTLTRVSLKNRNPDNTPNEWQAAVLESFEARKAAGEAPGGLAWHEVADTETGKEFRFMKAIPTGWRNSCAPGSGKAGRTLSRRQGDRLQRRRHPWRICGHPTTRLKGYLWERAMPAIFIYSKTIKTSRAWPAPTIPRLRLRLLLRAQYAPAPPAFRSCAGGSG